MTATQASMQRAAVPFPDCRPAYPPVRHDSPMYPPFEEEAGSSAHRRYPLTPVLGNPPEFLPAMTSPDFRPLEVRTAQPSRFPSLFRSIPYHRTIKGNPPRLVTTTTSLTILPGPPLDPSSQPGANHGIEIPSSFKIYVRAFHRHPRAYIAHHKREPLHALTYTYGDVTLHHGPQELSPPVAAYFHAGFWNPRKSPAHVRIACPEEPAAAAGLSGGGSVPLKYRKVTIENSSTFIVDVPDPQGGSALRPETFEWRPSYGPAIKAVAALGEGKSQSKIFHSGMKLVRLSTDAGHGGGDMATGGGEVVAVLYVGGMGHAKFSTRGFFMFQGTGAQGILGETFRVVAVMTAVGMWDRKRRRHGD